MSRVLYLCHWGHQCFCFGGCCVCTVLGRLLDAEVSRVPGSCSLLWMYGLMPTGPQLPSPPRPSAPSRGCGYLARLVTSAPSWGAATVSIECDWRFGLNLLSAVLFFF